MALLNLNVWDGDDMAHFDASPVRRVNVHLYSGGRVEVRSGNQAARLSNSGIPNKQTTALGLMRDVQVLYVEGRFDHDIRSTCHVFIARSTESNDAWPITREFRLVTHDPLGLANELQARQNPASADFVGRVRRLSRFVLGGGLMKARLSVLPDNPKIGEMLVFIGVGRSWHSAG